jgi:hypothetical protein
MRLLVLGAIPSVPKNKLSLWTVKVKFNLQSIAGQGGFVKQDIFHSEIINAPLDERRLFP